MSAGPWVEARAPAKVNLWLEVLGRRPDGYHEVDTLMLALDRADRVRARAVRGDLTIAVAGPAATPDIPADDRNLAWRAAARVLAHARRRDPTLGLELAVEKHVPSRAGLGGGSADAAAAWLAAAAALAVAIPAEERDRALAELGSDCVFFARAADTGSARCRGRGEVVEPRALPRTWNAVVVVPDLECSTADVYRACGIRLSDSWRAPTVPTDLFDNEESTVRRALFNRLEEAALCARPQSAEVRAWLDRSGADHFRLTGSGSAFFGLYAESGEAEEAERRLRSSAVRPLRDLFRAISRGGGARLMD